MSSNELTQYPIIPGPNGLSIKESRFTRNFTTFLTYVFSQDGKKLDNMLGVLHFPDINNNIIHIKAQTAELLNPQAQPNNRVNIAEIGRQDVQNGDTILIACSGQDQNKLNKIASIFTSPGNEIFSDYVTEEPVTEQEPYAYKIFRFHRRFSNSPPKHNLSRANSVMLDNTRDDSTTRGNLLRTNSGLSGTLNSFVDLRNPSHLPEETILFNIPVGTRVIVCNSDDAYTSIEDHRSLQAKAFTQEKFHEDSSHTAVMDPVRVMNQKNYHVVAEALARRIGDTQGVEEARRIREKIEVKDASTWVYEYSSGWHCAAPALLSAANQLMIAL